MRRLLVVQVRHFVNSIPTRKMGRCWISHLGGNRTGPMPSLTEKRRITPQRVKTLHRQNKKKGRGKPFDEVVSNSHSQLTMRPEGPPVRSPGREAGDN